MDDPVKPVVDAVTSGDPKTQLILGYYVIILLGIGLGYTFLRWVANRFFDLFTWFGAELLHKFDLIIAAIKGEPPPPRPPTKKKPSKEST